MTKKICWYVPSRGKHRLIRCKKMGSFLVNDNYYCKTHSTLKQALGEADRPDPIDDESEEEIRLVRRKPTILHAVNGENLDDNRMKSNDFQPERRMTVDKIMNNFRTGLYDEEESEDYQSFESEESEERMTPQEAADFIADGLNRRDDDMTKKMCFALYTLSIRGFENLSLLYADMEESYVPNLEGMTDQIIEDKEAYMEVLLGVYNDYNEDGILDLLLTHANRLAIMTFQVAFLQSMKNKK